MWHCCHDANHSAKVRKVRTFSNCGSEKFAFGASRYRPGGKAGRIGSKMANSAMIYAGILRCAKQSADCALPRQAGSLGACGLNKLPMRRFWIDGKQRAHLVGGNGTENTDGASNRFQRQTQFGQLMPSWRTSYSA